MKKKFNKLLKKIVFGLIIIISSHNTFAQTTLIPDTNFELALINLGLDTVLDGQVLTTNINTVESINLDNLSISDITGIEDFDSLKYLSCKQNTLSFLDITQNTELTTLDCRFNQLNSLNTSQNTGLITIRCSDNLISNLNLTQNIELKYLYCSNNPLTSLNVTQNPDLFWLFSNNTGLINLDISQNPLLKILECNNNQLTNLDFSQNPDLITLLCNDNQLTSINPGTTSALSILTCNNNSLNVLQTDNLVNLESLSFNNNNITNLTLNADFLQIIHCNNNQLTSLDLSQSQNINFVSCTNNSQLTYIDIRNSLPAAINTLIAIDNPILSCIITDDPTFNHSTNWQYNPLITELVETEADCSFNLGVLGHNKLTQTIIYPNPTSNYFSIKSLKTPEIVKIFSLNGHLIKSYSYQDLYSIEELSKGVYIIKLEYLNDSEVKLLLIE